MAKRFEDLSDQEILALAIGSEEEDSRIYGDIAEGLRTEFPATAKIFEGMREEEIEHRRSLTEIYREQLRPAHPIDSEAGREGVRTSPPHLAG